jgi:hypothetical protein
MNSNININDDSNEDSKKFIKTKDEIYQEVTDVFKQYNETYIKQFIDKMYQLKYLTDSISKPGWTVFIAISVNWKIKNYIKHDTRIAQKRLSFIKILNNDVVDCNRDVILDICEKYINN